MFTDWRAPRLTQLWIKQAPGLPSPVTKKRGSPPPPRSRPGTRCPARRRRPAPSSWASPAAGTSGCRISAPSSSPAPATSSSPSTCCRWPHAVPALHALNEIRDRSGPGPADLRDPRRRRRPALAQHLLPPGQRRVPLHLDRRPRPGAPRGRPALERQLAPFDPRPHWGKVFTIPPEALRSRYERLPDFLDLMRRFDPPASSATPTPTATYAPLARANQNDAHVRPQERKRPRIEAIVSEGKTLPLIPW